MATKKSLDKDISDIKTQAQSVHTQVSDLFTKPIPDIIILNHAIPPYAAAIELILSREVSVPALSCNNKTSLPHSSLKPKK